MHKGNYQLLYYTCLDFCSSQEQTNVQPFSKIIHLVSLIQIKNISYQKRQFFDCMLPHFLVLKSSGTNCNISVFLISVPILIFTDLQMSILYSLTTKISITIQQNKVKTMKTIETRLEFKTICFICNHDLQVQNFLIDSLLQICQC